MIEKYSLNKEGNKKISKHFKVKEFASINGNIVYTDDVYINTDLVDLLEKLFDFMSAYKIIITSGYRNTAHEIKVGNKSGKGYHTTGDAVDINVWKNAKERYTSKEICLALEDLEWKRGIGIISNTAVHIDARINKYYFDERDNNESIGKSFYEFFKEDKNKILNENIKKVCEEFGLDEEFWLDNYNSDLGKECIKDLFSKISSKL